MSGLAGRVALVTGAGRGVGLAIAAELADRGAQVCVTVAGDSEVDAAARVLGPSALVLPGSHDDPSRAGEVVQRVLDQRGALDLLVNSVPLGLCGGPLTETELLTLRRALTLDVVVPLAWVQRVYWAWMAVHGGAVLNVACVPAETVWRPPGGCDVGRLALIHLTRQLAAEMSPGVRVNAIVPAVNGSDAGPLDATRTRVTVAPTDLAALAAFLLSDQCSWISGETLVAHQALLTPTAAARPR